jgi:hypothetical protein
MYNGNQNGMFPPSMASLPSMASMTNLNQLGKCPRNLKKNQRENARVTILTPVTRETDLT